MKEELVDVGRSALTGWRGAVARPIAKPIAERTRFTEEQVEAIIGLAMLAYAVYRLVRPVVRALRA